MCDYCDCRSHPEVAALSADHEVLLALLADLRGAIAAGDARRATIVLGALHGRLEHHAAREERGVFTQLREAAVAGDYVDEFERDHHHIHELLDDAGRGHWQATAREVVELLGDHIAREESDLFPAAHQLLAPEQWDAVDNGSAEVSGPRDRPRILGPFPSTHATTGGTR